MLTKVMIALLPLLALAYGQTLPNVQELDPTRPGNFRLSWELLSNSINIQVQANCSGWVSLLLVSANGQLGDTLIGGHNDTTDLGYWFDFNVALNGTVIIKKDSFVSLQIEIEIFFCKIQSHLGLPKQDAVNNIAPQASVFHDPYTIARFNRPYDTGDAEDVPIPVRISYL